MTALHYAVWIDNPEMVQYFLEVGVLIDTRDNYGWTPFHHATRRGHLYIVKLLLEAGADYTMIVNINRTGRTIAHQQVIWRWLS